MSALEVAYEIWVNLGEPWHDFFHRYFGIGKIDDLSGFQEAMDCPRNDCRTVPGFEDFAVDTARGVEPGNLAASFLYHAVASPSVLPDGVNDDGYLAEDKIDAIENYVFAAAGVSMADLAQRAAGQPLAIAVFAKQYRNSTETTHLRHADLVFSRTGVARVGNEKERWNGRLRSFDSCVTGREGIPVLPCRYSAWVAVQANGNSAQSIPGRFQQGDDGLTFWTPLHKLFDGDDCIRDVRVKLHFLHEHRNEKLRRVHRALHWLGIGSMHSEPEISEEPFVATDLLDQCKISGDSCFVVPQPKIVERVERAGKPVKMFVPRNFPTADSSLHIMPRPRRWAPEYVYVRDAIVNGEPTDLNEEFDVGAVVRRGGFEAVHYRDFTGDGWVGVECPALAGALSRSLTAYSILAPPDLVPNVKQSDLLDWYNTAAPSDIKPNLWVGSSPVPLCDAREPANVSLPRSGFLTSDKTTSAMVGISSAGISDSPSTRAPKVQPFRTTTLPDDSSGIFAPGSEVGEDQTDPVSLESGDAPQPVPFFASYGMGSPFLEDTKLCSALSAFWPGTTPDTSRVYEPLGQPSVTPLTDLELPWDGSPLPIEIPCVRKVRHRSRAHTDYIRHTTFNFGLLADLTFEQYVERTITMARVYESLGATSISEKSRWVLLRFHRTPGESKEWRDLTLPPDLGPAWSLRMYRYTGYMPDRPSGEDITTFLVSFDEMIRAVANPSHVYLHRHGIWEHFRF